MPANVVLTGPRVPTVSAMSTTTDRLARFETAQEMIGLLIAARARALSDERGKSSPNGSAIAALLVEIDRFDDERDALRLDGFAEIERVIREYGPTVKAAYAR